MTPVDVEAKYWLTSEGVYRLLYVSDIAANAGGVLRATVADILTVSMRNNRRDAITGFLLCDGGRFVQALEGHRDAVEACFAQIEQDGRHEHIEVRRRGFASARDYPRWSMCALTLSDRENELLNAPHIEFDLRRAEAGALDQHLLGIARRHAAELDALHDELAAAQIASAGQQGLAI